MILNKKMTGRGNFNSLGQESNQPDMRLLHNRIYMGRREPRISAGGLAALAGFCLACALPNAVFAQTAHFSGAIRTLASGLNAPVGVTVDANGNVFFADSSNNEVKEIVAVNGMVPVNPTISVLGSGFFDPTNVALDSSGDVYVVDSGNSAVKEMLAVNGAIPSSPTIDTLVQQKRVYTFGVAVSEAGAVFLTWGTDVERLRYVRNLPVLSMVGGSFNRLKGIAIDQGGNIYVADEGNSAVYEVLASGGYSTVVTLGSGFDAPQAVAVDPYGDVFVADTGHDLIKEIVAVNGSIPANPAINVLGAQFLQPEGVAVDGAGNVYVADTGHNEIREIVAGGNFGSVNVGSSSSFVLPMFFTFDTGGKLQFFASGSLYGTDFSDAGTGTCQYVTSYNAGDICTKDVVFKPTAPGLRSGSGFLLDPSDNLVAAGLVHGTGVGPRLNFLPGQQSLPISGLGKPYGLATDSFDDVFYSDAATGTITQANPFSNYATLTDRQYASTYSFSFTDPRGVAIDGFFNIFVADYGDGEVKEILDLPNSASLQTIGSGFSAPSAVAVDGSGNVFVADAGNGTVKEILISNNYATTITLASGFNQPAGIAVDANGNVYVTDYLASTVSEILAVNGVVPANPTIVQLGSGFNGPWGIAVDANGDVIVADYGNNAVKKMVAVNGVIPSSPTINLLGTGWDGPSAVAINSFGVVFVSNANSGTISQLDYADPPTLTFEYTVVGSVSTDSPKFITFVNQGTAPLNAVPPGLSFPADFKPYPGTGTGPDCTAAFSLAPGEECNLNIEFAPTVVGSPLNESVVITDNYINTGTPGVTNQSQSIPMEGAAELSKPATLTSPAAGTVLGASNVTFKWNAAAGASGYQLQLGTMGVGTDDLFTSAEITGTSITVATLPTNGATVYVRLWTAYPGVGGNGGLAGANDYTYTESTVPAALISPTPGGSLPGASVTFTWSAAYGSTNYKLFIGSTGKGSYNLYYSGNVTATSATVGGLPTNGETLYARLYTNFNGTLVYFDYTYKAAPQNQAMMTSPAPGSALPGTGVTFNWTTVAAATDYELFIGSTGPGAYNLYYSGNTLATSATVGGLPTNGQIVYVRLYTKFGGVLQYNDYVYTAVSQAPAVLTSPKANSAFPSTSVTFTWTAATGATDYELFIGSTGPGSYNLFYSGNTTAISLVAGGLPTNGEMLYARLYTKFNGTLEYSDYTFKAVSAAPAVLTSPANGSTLPGASATFTWTAATAATDYELFVGSTSPGSYNLYYSGDKTVTSLTVNGLPTNGETVYVRLYTNFNGTLEYADYTFTAK
jgi:streptogramin lyase